MARISRAKPLQISLQQNKLMPGTLLTCRVTSLDHEPTDVSMEDRFIVVPARAESEKILS